MKAYKLLHTANVQKIKFFLLNISVNQIFTFLYYGNLQIITYSFMHVCKALDMTWNHLELRDKL